MRDELSSIKNVNTELNSSLSQILKDNEVLNQSFSEVSVRCDSLERQLIEERKEKEDLQRELHEVKLCQKIELGLSTQEIQRKRFNAPKIVELDIQHEYIHPTVPVCTQICINDNIVPAQFHTQKTSENYQTSYVLAMKSFSHLYGDELTVVYCNKPLMYECYNKLFNNTIPLDVALPLTVFSQDDKSVVAAKIFLSQKFGLQTYEVLRHGNGYLYYQLFKAFYNHAPITACREQGQSSPTPYKYSIADNVIYESVFSVDLKSAYPTMLVHKKLQGHEMFEFLRVNRAQYPGLKTIANSFIGVLGSQNDRV